jgi:DUF4097 and DUF4098 domain-containing protein YvlB
MSTLFISSHSTQPRRAWIAAGLFVPGFLLLCASSAFAQRIEKRFKVDSRPVITIHNPDGIITVRAWSKHEVMVVANRASNDIELEIEQTGNRVDVMTHQMSDTIAPAAMHADYEISVPEDAELQIHDDAGNVSVANVLGDMNVETVAAGVNLQDAAGYLTVKTVGGSFQCIRCAGRIEVTSISGSFKFIDLRSYHVRAQTSKGSISFDGEFLPNGNYSLKNYSGDIVVRYAPADSFDLSATSYRGKVFSDAKLKPPAHEHHFWHPKFGNSLFGSLNLGHARVDLSSFDGTINIVQRN